MVKLATDIKKGDIIISPHTASYYGIVERIETTSKKITFHITFTSKENKGDKWCYTFKKTTKIKCK